MSDKSRQENVLLFPDVYRLEMLNCMIFFYDWLLKNNDGLIEVEDEYFDEIYELRDLIASLVGRIISEPYEDKDLIDKRIKVCSKSDEKIIKMRSDEANSILPVLHKRFGFWFYPFGKEPDLKFRITINWDTGTWIETDCHFTLFLFSEIINRYHFSHELIHQLSNNYNKVAEKFLESCFRNIKNWMINQITDY